MVENYCCYRSEKTFVDNVIIIDMYEEDECILVKSGSSISTDEFRKIVIKAPVALKLQENADPRELEKYLEKSDE